MTQRQIAIAVASVLAAFGVAFGVGKATVSGDDGPSSAGSKAKQASGTESVELGSATITASIAPGGSLPELKDRPQQHRKKTEPKSDPGPTPTPGPNPTPTPTPTAAATATAVPTATAPPADPTPPPDDGGGGGGGGGGGSGGG